MKKLLLALSIVGFLGMTSCKKAAKAADNVADTATEAASSAADATADAASDMADTASEAASSAADAASDAAGSVADVAKGLFGSDFNMPEFSTEEGKQWANNLVDAAASVKKAATEGNPDALKSATANFNSIAEQAKSFAGSPDVAKAAELVKQATSVVSNL